MPPRSGLQFLSFPSFSGFTRRVVLANVIAFFAFALLSIASPPAAGFLFSHVVLTWHGVSHGEVWQLVTYSFINTGLFGFLLSMLALWFIGAYLEGSYGTRWITEVYLVSVLGAALTALAIGGRVPYIPAGPLWGAAAAVDGIFIAFAMLLGNTEVMLFPLPMRIRAKYLAALYVLLALYFAIRGDLANIAYLGGMLAVYLYVKFAPRRGFLFSTSEWYFGLRNAYYRNKRRRAARKFEIYMGKQGRDVRFDKEGRYIDPDKNPNDKRWMN